MGVLARSGQRQGPWPRRRRRGIALQAGIPIEQLLQVAAALTRGRGRLQEMPVRSAAPHDVLGESDHKALVGDDVQSSGAQPQGPSDQVAAAVTQLTEIRAQLTAGHAERDPLEGALDGLPSGGSAGSDDAPGPAASRRSILQP